MLTYVRLERVGGSNRTIHHEMIRHAAPETAHLFKFPNTQPWIARITGLCDKYKYRREFIRARRNYHSANSAGTRGIYYEFYFEASPHDVFEVWHKPSWKRAERYFCRFVNGEPVRISEDQVCQSLNNHSE